MQSSISHTIDTVDREAQYDSCVKKILSEKIILAWILKECVKEFKSFSIVQIMRDCIPGEIMVSVHAVDQDVPDKEDYAEGTQIDGSNTEDASVNEGTVYYDIRFNAIVPTTGEPVQLIINIEAQKSDKTSYPLTKRAFYYIGRMISAQKNKVFTKSHYEKIRKVYSIWIQMNVDEDKANTITAYHVAEENIVGAYHESEENYDLLTVIMIGLGKADNAEEQPILKLLDTLLSADTDPADKKRILEDEFDIPMSVSMVTEVNEMCNLGEGLVEITTIKNMITSITSVMSSLDVDVDRAMEILKIDSKDQDLYREKIAKLATPAS